VYLLVLDLLKLLVGGGGAGAFHGFLSFFEEAGELGTGEGEVRGAFLETISFLALFEGSLFWCWVDSLFEFEVK
jgi:hypothetical protein